MKRSTAAAVALSLAAVLGTPAAAGATVSTGNLLANPGAEDGAAASNGTDAPDLAGWGKPLGNPKLIAVTYGSPGGFPAFAPIGGGGRFFAGGPPPATGEDDSIRVVSQTVAFPASAQSEIDAGQVQGTLSGCLGGFADQDDFAGALATYQKADNGGLGSYKITGPNAAERNNETKLLPFTATIDVPPQAVKAVVYLESARKSGTGTYNDGYADKLSFSLSNTGTAAPAPDCSYPAGTPVGGGGGGGGTNGGSNGGTSLLSKVGTSATLSHGRLVLRLRCVARETCKGSVALTIGRLPALHARASAVTLGKARFSIAVGKSKKVRVKLRRKARRRLGALSRRRLGRTKVTVRTRIGSSSTKFSLKLRR